MQKLPCALVGAASTDLLSHPNKKRVDREGATPDSKMVGECMDLMGVYCRVEAVLYKLLFYEVGGHFDWHRDTVRCSLTHHCVAPCPNTQLVPVALPMRLLPVALPMFLAHNRRQDVISLCCVFALSKLSGKRKKHVYKHILAFFLRGGVRMRVLHWVRI